MGGNGIVGGGIPLALGAAFSAQYQGHRPGVGRLLQRRGVQPGHLRRVAEPGRAVEAARAVRVREQPLRRHHARGASTARRTSPAGPARTACRASAWTATTALAVREAARAAVAAHAAGRGARACWSARPTGWSRTAASSPTSGTQGERETWIGEGPDAAFTGRRCGRRVAHAGGDRAPGAEVERAASRRRWSSRRAKPVAGPRGRAPRAVGV